MGYVIVPKAVHLFTNIFAPHQLGLKSPEPLPCASKIQEEEFHQKPTNDGAAVLENLGEKEMKEQLGIRYLWMGKEINGNPS